MKPVDEWEKLPNGNLRLAALHDAGVIMIEADKPRVLLRLEYADQPGQLESYRKGQSTPLALQLALAIPEAERLIQMLQAKLDALHPPDGRTH